MEETERHAGSLEHHVPASGLETGLAPPSRVLVVGIFPEQGENWNFIMETIRGWKKPQTRVLNLFAYTGAASVVAKDGGR